jgi:hypothetical protein
MQLRRPIKTRFRYAYTYRLKLAAQTKSLTHYTKGTPSGAEIRRSLSLRLLVGIRFQELFHSPYRGAFHLSLTVLGLEGGPPTFEQNFTCSALLKDPCAFYRYGAITRYGPTFQTVLVITHRPLAWSPFARRY